MRLGRRKSGVVILRKLSLATSALAIALLGWLQGRPAAALDPARSLAQFEHTSWTVKQGAPADIWALAQSKDGYLWLGTGSGLYRFDGVKFERFKPQDGGELSSIDITALLALPNGELWIGDYEGGVSRLKDGRLTTFTAEGRPKSLIAQFVQGKDGSLWVASSTGLSRLKGGAWTHFGPEQGFPDETAISGLAVTPDGTLWAAAFLHQHTLSQDKPLRLYFLSPGSNRFEPVRGALSNPRTFAQSEDGRLWVSDAHGEIWALDASAGRSQNSVLPHRVARIPGVTQMVFARDGSLWGGQRGRGVFRARPLPDAPGRLTTPDHFLAGDGLTSAIVVPVVEDHEGNIWIGTNQGLDRFRATKVVAETSIPATAPDGYSAANAPDGSLYVSADRTIFRIGPDGAVKPAGAWPTQVRCFESRRDGGVWVGGGYSLSRVEGDRWRKVELPRTSQGGRVANCAVDQTGALWIDIWIGGRNEMFRLDAHGWREVKLPNIVATPPLSGITPDAEGGVWLFVNDILVRLRHGEAQLFSGRNGPGVGNIETVAAAPGGILIGGELGLAHFDGRTMRTLQSRRVPDLEGISGIVQTRGETWLNGMHGLIHLPTSRLEDAFQGRRPPKYELIGFLDGLPGPAQQNGARTLFQAADGRLWMITNHGVAWVDTSLRNTVPPPVAVTAIGANAKTFVDMSDLSLPGGTSNLRIDFTAPSLTIPEKVQFRYNLEGVDNGWIDPAGRRQAFYTKLGPGAYRFRVIASNNDGVWNRTGSAITFKILPTFYQSAWFISLLAIAMLCVLYGLYRLRIEYLSRLIKDKLSERMRERERIARELHDTLLQSFQGLTLSFRAAAARLPSDHAARKAMDHALLRAEQALTEGRERVQDLRAADAPRDLSALFAGIAEKLKPDPSLKVRVVIEGKTRELHPLVREEIGRIGEEAMFNTLRHAEAGMFEVGVTYASDRLTVRFQDDGKGIDPALVQNGGRAGHFGIRGMRERAQRIHGEFVLASAAGAGAEITVVVPAKVAYVAADGKGFSVFRRLAREY